jgi:hypothetical protein
MAEPLRLPLLAPLLQRDATSDKDALATNVFYDSVEDTTYATKRPGIDTLISGLGEAQGIFFYDDTLFAFYDTATVTPLGTGFDRLSYTGSQWFAADSDTSAYAFGTTGLNWTNKTLAASPLRVSNISVANGVTFVRLNNGTLYSVTGTYDFDFTSITLPTSVTPSSDIVYGNSKYVFTTFTSGQYKSVYSTDGISWSIGNVIPTVPGALAFGNGVFMTVTGSFNPTYSTSTDGISWTARSLPVSINGYTLSNLVFNGSFFCFLAYSAIQTYAFKSTDAITWTVTTLGVRATGALAFNGTSFAEISVNSSSRAVHISTDAITWTTYATALPATANWRALAFGDGYFVALASSGTTSAKSVNGITWTATPTSPVTESF